jgi:hypothetical protein
MHKQKGRDYSDLLIWAAALVTVVRYAAAFIASDMGEITGVLSEAITILMGLSGLGMGILDVIGGTYLFDGWRRNMPRNGQSWPFKFKVLTGFVFALMATGVMILVPFTESRVTHASMANVLGDGAGLTWWAFLVNVAPYLLIGGVAIGNQVVTVESSQSSLESSPKVEESSQKVRYDWRKFAHTFSDDELVEIAGAEAGGLQEKYPGMTPKTEQNWRKRAVGELSNRHWSVADMERRGIKVKQVTKVEA